MIDQFVIDAQSSAIPSVGDPALDIDTTDGVQVNDIQESLEPPEILK